MQKRPRRNAKAEQATDHAMPRVSGDLSGRLFGSPHRLRSDRAGLWGKKEEAECVGENVSGSFHIIWQISILA